MFNSFHIELVTHVPNEVTVKQVDINGVIDDMATPAGAWVEAIDAVNGNIFNNVVGKTFAIVWNDGATGDIVVNQVTQYTRDGLALADKSVTIPAGDFAIMGPYTSTFNDGSKKVTFTYSGAGVADGKIGVFKL